MRVLVKEYGASILSTDHDGITPLLVAAMSGQVERDGVRGRDREQEREGGRGRERQRGSERERERGGVCVCE